MVSSAILRLHILPYLGVLSGDFFLSHEKQVVDEVPIFLVGC